MASSRRGVEPKPGLADRVLPRVYRVVGVLFFAVDFHLISCFRRTLELDSVGACTCKWYLLGFDWNIVNQSEQEGEHDMLCELVFVQYMSSCLCSCMLLLCIHIRHRMYYIHSRLHVCVCVCLYHIFNIDKVYASFAVNFKNCVSGLLLTFLLQDLLGTAKHLYEVSQWGAREEKQQRRRGEEEHGHPDLPWTVASSWAFISWLNVELMADLMWCFSVSYSNLN